MVSSAKKPRTALAFGPILCLFSVLTKSCLRGPTYGFPCGETCFVNACPSLMIIIPAQTCRFKYNIVNFTSNPSLLPRSRSHTASLAWLFDKPNTVLACTSSHSHTSLQTSNVFSTAFHDPHLCRVFRFCFFSLSVQTFQHANPRGIFGTLYEIVGRICPAL